MCKQRQCPLQVRNLDVTSTKIVKELGELGVYCAGVNFTSFDAAEAKQYNHIFSFMESSFAKHFRAKEQKIAVDLYNLRYMMRVYPDRTRITSNNFDPLLNWRRGIQMVALNWHTFALGMQISRAMFDGGQDFSGYVLKTAELRDIQALPYNPELPGVKKERSVVSFTIDVISAQRLMRPASLPANKAMNPYVEVEVFHDSDKREKRKESALPRDLDPPQKFRMNIIRENGFNPMFDGHFKFKVTKKQPDLVLFDGLSNSPTMARTIMTDRPSSGTSSKAIAPFLFSTKLVTSAFLKALLQDQS